MRFYRKDKGIISLVAILTIGLLALSAVTISLMGALKELTKNRNNIKGEQSFYTAEAAAREGVYQYKQNPNSYTQDITIPFKIIDQSGELVFLNTSTDQQITIKPVTPATWPYGEVIGVAANDMPNGTTSRKIIFTTTVFPEGEAFNYAAYAENTIDLTGNATINGDIFVNNTATGSGSADINGNVFLANTINDEDKEDLEKSISEEYSLFSDVKRISPPIIAIQPYREIAEINGTFFTDSKDLNSENTGVIFIENETEKDIVVNNSVTGALVVNTNGKKLKLTGGIYTASSDYPAVVVEGDLSISGGTIIYGIVYVKGSTSFGAGNNTINGSLLCTGETTVTDITGRTTINYDPTYTSDWQDLLGLYKTSQENPKITSWREE
jgi:hypothetical protein